MYGRVDIVRHGRVVGVLLSPKAFQELRQGSAREPAWGAAHAIPSALASAARVIKPPGDFDD